MALLLETVLGDLVIELDIEGSPELSRNFLKLAKARYYTNTLIYNVTVNRFCQGGDPIGDGSGGACIHGLLDESIDDLSRSTKRFLKSHGRRLTAEECQEKGRVVATEMNGVPDTIGSQFLITLASGEGRALDGYNVADGESKQTFLSLGRVVEDDNNVLDQIAAAYCDANGRPFADIRVVRALVIHDPFEDPEGMDRLLKKRGVVVDEASRVLDSPSPERPPEEKVTVRIQINEVDMDADEKDAEKLRKREEEAARKEDRGRAVVLEMLGDLPDADIRAPENVLFICKLNPITMDEDLELILSRFDPNVKVEIIRDHDTGNSLQYAFAEFSNKQQAAEAYFKMNNALVDDRRIKVDFSQSVAKIWDKYSQQMKMPTGGPGGTFGGSGGREHPHGGRGRGVRGGRGPNGGGRGRGRDRDDRRTHDHQRLPHEHGRRHRNYERDHDGRQRHDDRNLDRRHRQYEEDRERDHHHHDDGRHRGRYSDDEDHNGHRHEHRRHRHHEEDVERHRHKDDRGRRHREDSHEHRTRHIDSNDSNTEDEGRHRKRRKKRKERDRHHRHDSDGSGSGDEERHRKHRKKRKEDRRHRHRENENSHDRRHRKHKHRHRERDRGGDEAHDHHEGERHQRERH